MHTAVTSERNDKIARRPLPLAQLWVHDTATKFAPEGKRWRRRITRQYTWNGSWQLTKEVHDVYAGNVVVQERDQNNLPQVSYTRGNDLSGTLEGAGGIGGLLARTDNAKLNLSDPFATTVYHADENGNVTALIYKNATMAAKYLYDPYGNTLAESGPLAEGNAYRFSSKEWDANAGLYYYLYRFYDPNLQRWPNRDPLGEPGFELLRQVGEDVESTGPNLYAFVRNDPVNQFDPLGLKEKKEKSYWDWVKEMADKVKKAAKDYEDGKCPKDPCKLPSSLNALCTCMYEAAKNKSVEDMIQCVCMTSPDSECEKKARKAIESVYGGK